MTISDSNQIVNFISEHMPEMDLADQLMVGYHYEQFVKSVQPIYLKYASKSKSEKFIVKL